MEAKIVSYYKGNIYVNIGNALFYVPIELKEKVWVILSWIVSGSILYLLYSTTQWTPVLYIIFSMILGYVLFSIQKNWFIMQKKRFIRVRKQELSLVTSLNENNRSRRIFYILVGILLIVIAAFMFSEFKVVIFILPILVNLIFINLEMDYSIKGSK